MATITFTTKFNLVTGRFVFIDTTNYPAQTPAILTSSVNGSFKITAPSGTVIYNNTTYTNGGCDIDVATSTTNQLTISLPLDSDGLVEPGVYTIVYTVFDSVLTTYYTTTNTYTYSYISPEVEITQTVDCLSPLFTSVDSTDYVVDGITPVKVEVHTIDYPYGSDGEGSPVIGSTTTVTTSTFYNGTQTTEISSSLTYTNADGLIIIDTVTGVKEVLVDCTDVCGIYCCIKSIEQQMMDNKGVNSGEYARLMDLFAQIMGYVGLALLAIRCGKSDDVSDFLSRIRTLSQCTSDCSCSGDEPTQVTGIGGLVNSVVVDSGGAPVEVEAVTVGNTTTYTVSLSSTFVDSINGFYNTIVAAGNNITVSDSGIVAGVRTFTINGLSTVVAAGANIAVTPSGPTAGVTTYTISTTGGDIVLHNSMTPVSNAAYTLGILQPYTLGIAELATNGDTVELVSSLDLSVTTGAGIISLFIGGASVVPIPPTQFYMPSGAKYCLFKAIISRQSATTVFIQFDLSYTGGTDFNSVGGQKMFASAVSVANLTTNTNLIELRGGGSSATLTAYNLMVLKYKI